jgi:hypothetical protein
MEFEARRAEKIRHAGRVLVPLARCWSLRLPGRLGGFVWNRPLGVVVKSGGERSFLPVPDRTRQIQWLLWGAGVATAMLVRAARTRCARRRRERFFFRR